MASVVLPRYVRRKALKTGAAFYWELPGWAHPPAARFGRTCPIVATALGPDLGRAIEIANQLNEALDGWRRGHTETKSQLVSGSVAWLFDWYRNHRRFTKNTPKTQNDYRKLMDAVASLPMRVGVFGERTASKVGPEVADKIYDLFLPRGKCQAVYVVQVCRAVWNVAGPYSKATGVTRGENPFAGIGATYKAKKGNRPTSRAEYDAYCATARKLGFPSMATAAVLSFELVQRVWDCFGIPDPDLIGSSASEQEEADRGIKWEDYKAGASIVVIQSKSGKPLKIPLVDRMPDGEQVALYPELESQLAAVRPINAKGLIVLEERSGERYEHRRMSSVHRKICDAAGLPKDMTFTGFRHGGATELGDSGEVDIRPLSGHVQLDTTAIYNKISHEKAVRIATTRREHIARIGAKNSDLSE